MKTSHSNQTINPKGSSQVTFFLRVGRSFVDLIQVAFSSQSERFISLGSIPSPGEQHFRFSKAWLISCAPMGIGVLRSLKNASVKWQKSKSPKAGRETDRLFTTRSSLSPSATKVRFRNHLDHRPKREILKARLAHLQFLLRDSKPSLTQIAEMMQFKLTLELSRFLVRETGERQTFRRRQFTDDSSPIPRR